MPPQRLSLTQNHYVTNGLIPVAIASVVNECNICKDTYSNETRPVLLQGCGHIFCRTCITQWFDEGANTCPMCRKALFHPSENQEEDEMTNMYGPGALAPRPIRTASRMRTRSIEEIFVDGSIIARDGTLTYYGCQFVIHDLLCHTAQLLHSFESFSGPVTDPLDVDVEFLRSCIQHAIPGGMRCSEGCWAVLYGCVRQMLVWHQEGGWSEAFEDMVDDLFEVCEDV